jgi:hypothetical protein
MMMGEMQMMSGVCCGRGGEVGGDRGEGGGEGCCCAALYTAVLANIMPAVLKRTSQIAPSHRTHDGMSEAIERCVHWQPDWGAGQSHCRRCRKSATCDLPQIKARSGSVAVAGVLEFLQRIRRNLSPVVDCSGGNAAAGQIFMAAMHSNPSAWGDACGSPTLHVIYVEYQCVLFPRRQRAKHQPQVEGLLNAALSVCSPCAGSDRGRDLHGACVVELGAGERAPSLHPYFYALHLLHP